MQVDDWGAFDVFRVRALSGGRPLQRVVLAVLQRFDLVEKLKLPEAKLRSFLKVQTAFLGAEPPPRGVHAVAGCVQPLQCLPSGKEDRCLDFSKHDGQLGDVRCSSSERTSKQ